MGLHPRKPTKHARRAALRTGVALTVLLACALVIAAVILFDRIRVPSVATASPDREQSAAAQSSAPLATVDAPGRAPKPSSETYDPTSFGPERFEGRGRVRGEVFAVEGVTFPATWTLVLEPHPYLTGSEHAERKRVEFTAGERMFDVPDLPLGGYRIRVEAPELNGSEVAALLVKGSSVVYATLEFHATGFVDGRVLAANGAPADGIDVTLEEKSTQLRTSVHADASGQFVFKGVRDGEYRLFIGAPESPLLPAGNLGFKAPTMRYPDATLPPTGTLTIHTNNQDGSPLGEVDLSGFGAPQGSLRAKSGPNARVRVPWLLPGTYNIEGVSLDGRRGRVIADVRVDLESDAILNLVD